MGTSHGWDCWEYFWVGGVLEYWGVLRDVRKGDTRGSPGAVGIEGGTEGSLKGGEGVLMCPRRY